LAKHQFQDGKSDDLEEGKGRERKGKQREEKYSKGTHANTHQHADKANEECHSFVVIPVEADVAT
jgi:hypothetical protein